MAISSNNGPDRSPVSSPKDKAKRKKQEIKRKQVEKRLEDLAKESKKMKVESKHKDMPLICAPLEEYATNDLHRNVGVSASAMERAEEVEANLPSGFPSFVKLMLKSHVIRGFWLGLPKKFCDAHLPDKNVKVALVAENDEKDTKKYKAKYLAEKVGLSGGWKRFAQEHKLLEGDALVFQLIERLKFKVYIVRARELTEVDGAMGLLNLDVAPEPIETVKMGCHLEENPERTQLEQPEPLELDNDHQDKGIDENIESETSDGIRFSESPLSFKNIKCFEDFSIQFDGLVIDSELPRHLRTKYYDLCLSRGMFLHQELMQGLNFKLAAGVISETINIADAIRAATASMEPCHLESWDKTLKAFGELGMNVGFLRERIGKLLGLSCELQANIDMKRAQRGDAHEVIRGLELRRSNLRKMIDSLDEEIHALEVKKKKFGLVFKEVAGAPW